MEDDRKLLEKMQIIEHFIALSLRREKIEKNASLVMQEVNEVKELLESAKYRLWKKLEEAKIQYELLMKRTKRQQAIILDYVVKERKQKLCVAEMNEELCAKALISNTVNVTGSTKKCTNSFNLPKLLLNQAVSTPKMSIIDYKQSPLIKRSRPNPIPFIFSDFEYQLTLKQFEMIPKYMRGRDTFEELSSFLENIVIQCFNEKYQLLHRERTALRNPNDLALWKLYKEQATYIPGRNFITLGDISRKINKMLDKKLQNRIIMLRHIGVLQEQRKSQTVCYIWAADPLGNLS